MISYLKLFLISFLITYLCTPIIKRIAIKLGILDHPKGHKTHAHPTPLLGGVAIYTGFVLGTLSSLDYNQALKGILVASTIILFLGLIDDIRHLPASTRLFGQIIASLILVIHGIRIDFFHNFYLNVFATVFGIVGITNALNFLDNMDGLAAGLAAMCSLSIFAIAYQTRQSWLSYLALALAASCLAFLRYNFKPAKIFMGDSGSTFLGFTIAGLAVMGEWSYHLPVTITLPTLIFGVLIFDTTLITVLRIKEGKVRNFRQWIEHADTDHFSHRLVNLGLSQRQAVLVIYFCNLALGIVAILIPKESSLIALLAFSVFLLIVVFGILGLDKAKINGFKLGRRYIK